jgi:hypothetical protein
MSLLLEHIVEPKRHRLPLQGANSQSRLLCGKLNSQDPIARKPCRDHHDTGRCDVVAMLLHERGQWKA